MNQAEKEILVSIQDSKNRANKYLYSAKILQTGRLSAHDPLAGGISIDEPIRYSYTEEGQIFPFLKEAQIIEKEIYKTASFFVNIRIESLRSIKYKISDFVKGKSELWQQAGNIQNSLKHDELKKTVLKIPDMYWPSILFPISKEEFYKNRLVSKDQKTEGIPLQEIKDSLEKGKRTKYKLIAKKTVISK